VAMGELVPVLVPEELVGSVLAVVGVIERFRESASRREEDFGTSERELGARVSEVEAGAQALMLGELDETADRIEVGGQVYRRLDPPYPETYAGLRAGVRVTRHLYRLAGRRNGPTIVPVELRAGIVEGRYTPGAAVGLAHLNQAMPSREADEVARSLGVLPYSRSAQFRGGTAMGERWAELEATVARELIADVEIPNAARSIALAIDRVSMPMAEDREPTPEDIKRGVKNPIAVQLRMAFAACWTLCDDWGKPVLCVRYAHVPEGGADAMVQRLRADLDAMMARRPDLRICTLADGSPEMQALLDRVVEDYEVTAQMVDFWHFAEYLGKAASVMGKPVEATLGRFKGYLIEWDSGVDAVEVELKQWLADANATTSAAKAPAQATGPPEELVDALRYIKNQRARLRYATPYHLGLPIGSGHVEATAKTIFETRMKRTGCRWRPEGAQALLGLRALATSSPSRWRAAMARILATFRASVTPLPVPT
jgi:hypothetical protein